MGNTRDDILRSAVALFCERGFRETTIRDICGHAGANIAAVNYHFKGKLGLGEAVIDYLFEPVADAALASPKLEKINSDEEWRRALRGFIYDFIFSEKGERSRHAMRSNLVFRELDAPTELFPIMFNKYMRPIQNRLRGLVRMGLPPDSDEESADLWFLTIISQCVMFRKKPSTKMGVTIFDLSDPAVAERIATHVAGTVFSTLRYNPDSAMENSKIGEKI